MQAAIDVGTNTVRLLVGKVDGGRLQPQQYARRITRLGGGYSEIEGLSPQARGRTLAALTEFSQICAEFDVERVRAVGTAAFRRAVNGQSFAREVAEQTGLPLEVISGDEEARLTVAGVMSALDPVPPAALVMDIGGGSTEFALVASGRILWEQSLPLGVVRLCEEVAAPAEQQRIIHAALQTVHGEIAGASGTLPAGLRLVGTAGTVTTLAAIDMAMTSYDWRRVNNYRLPADRLRALHAQLAPLTATAREAIPGLEPGRGDLILPGLEIVLAAIEIFSADALVVSDFGILEGVLLGLAGPRPSALD